MSRHTVELGFQGRTVPFASCIASSRRARSRATGYCATSVSSAGSGSDFRHAKLLAHAGLDVAAVDPRRLLANVEQEPQLDAGPGHRNVNPGALGGAHRLVESMMLVDVEHAPDLVVRASLAAPPSDLDGRALDESTRRTVEVVDRERDVLADHSRPVREVHRLGPLALGERED